MQLQRGEKRGLSDLGIGSSCTVKIDFGLDGIDIAAFGLNADKKIGNDAYVVLFSNLSSPEGAIKLSAGPGTATFNLELDRLPASIDRIVLTATHDTQPVANSRPFVVTVDGTKAIFDVAQHLTTEKAVMLVEFYRHSSGWKLGTIGAGFNGGLAALVDISAAKLAIPALLLRRQRLLRLRLRLRRQPRLSRFARSPLRSRIRLSASRSRARHSARSCST